MNTEAHSILPIFDYLIVKFFGKCNYLKYCESFDNECICILITVDFPYNFYKSHLLMGTKILLGVCNWGF